MRFFGFTICGALFLASAVLGAEKKTVFAVAVVAGQTKQVAGETYQLVAIRLDPAIHLLGSGLTSQLLLINGVEKQLDLESDEAKTFLDPGHRITMKWLKRPAEGQLEIMWGALADPKEKPEMLRQRLLKAGYLPLSIDHQKVPKLNATNHKELLNLLDEIATQKK